MGVLIMVGQVLLGLAILIILHELGHYLAARAFGIRVEKFFLFFDAWGFKLFSIKRGDTEIGIGWLPLGGYVKIAGMIDESMDKEQMALPPKPDEFRSKPAWQRLIVMLAGIAVNVILGIIIFWIITIRYGETYTPLSEYKFGIVPGKALSDIGVKPGDRILSIAGKPVFKDKDLYSSVLLYGNTNLKIQRDSAQANVFVPANFFERFTKAGSRDELFTPRSKSMVDSLPPNSRAAAAGLQKGDQIYAVNKQLTPYFDQLQAALSHLKGQDVELVVIRNQKLVTLHEKLDTAGRIGFVHTLPDFKVAHERFGFFKSLDVGTNRAFTLMTDNAKGLLKVARREVSPKSLSGPIGIAKIYGSEFDWEKFWSITGMLSMALAFMNILPIPALDGGHALFLIVEMIKGKPLSVKFLENAQIAGFFIIMGLMVFIFGNDIMKFFVK